MLDKPISLLRQRMIEHMTARCFNEHTQRDYVRNVRMFAAFARPVARDGDEGGPSPLSTAYGEAADERRVHFNAAIAALRFFFTVTLERPDLVLPLTTVNKPRRAPVVLSQEEVARSARSRARPEVQKPRFSVAYGAGLRVSEVANPKVSDIGQPAHDASGRAGQGQRDRLV